MNLTKDTYEYILNFATDRDIINMLSSNKKFRNNLLFERVMKKKYPLVVRFKDSDLSWTDFFIQTVYYLSKLEEKYNLKYMPTLDFDPKHIYRTLSFYKNISEELKEINNEYKRGYDKEYHGIARLVEGKYIIDPNFIKGRSLGSFVSPNIFKLDDETLIDIVQDKNSKMEWLTLELEDGVDTNYGIHADKKSAERFLYENYEAVVEEFIQDMINVQNIDEDSVILNHSTLDADWRDPEKFHQKINSANYPRFFLYRNLPNMDQIRFDFQLIHINLP